MGGEFLDLRFVLRFGLRQMGGEFLDLRFVVRFGFRQMGRESHLHLWRFRVREWADLNRYARRDAR